MRGREIRDHKAIAREILVQQAVHGNSDIPAGALERSTISTAEVNGITRSIRWQKTPATHRRIYLRFR
jgi:hypothetical protein